MTTRDTDGRLEQGMEEAKRETLAELERELDAAGDKLGAATVEFEWARFWRDRARAAHVRAMGRLDRHLRGEDL